MEEKEFVNDAEIVVSKVLLETNPKEPEEVNRVVMETEKGRITYKPKIEKTEFRDGFQITRKQPCKYTEMPLLLLDIAKQIQKTSRCKVKASYNVWNTEQDGSPVTYRFIQSEKTLDKWEILKEQDEVVNS